jgi:hypothetical protein
MVKKNKSSAAKAAKRASKNNRRKQVRQNRMGGAKSQGGHYVQRFIDTSGGGLANSIASAYHYHDTEKFGYGNSNSRLGISGSSGNPYLDCLVDPSREPQRIPDLYSKNTAVHQSFFNFTVTPQQITTGTGDNIFAVALNPVLGNFAAGASWRHHTISYGAGDGAGVFQINNLDDPDYVTLDDCINEIRPVSACLFVTYVGDTLSDGGQIAAAFIPSGGSQFAGTFPINPASGQPYYNFTATAQQPGAYIGPLKKGCMIRWSPEDERDSFFYSGSQSNAHDFPSLVVAGISTQNSPNVRVLGWVNYEFTTQRLFFDQRPSPINTQQIEHAKRALQGMEYACANDEHESIWSRFLNWASGAVKTVEDVWNNDIKPVVAPALIGGGKVLTALGMPELGMPLKGAGMYLKPQQRYQ